MIDVASSQSARLTMPPEQFYWAILDGTSAGTVSGRARTRLGYLFENVLPEPIEQVHTSFAQARKHSRQVIACGMNIDRLRALLAEHPGLVQFGPQALPDFIAEQFDDIPGSIAERLNLLHTAFEPALLRKGRRRLGLLLVIFLVLSASALAFGSERRANAIAHQADAISQRRTQLITQSIGPSGGGQSPDVRLIAELRKLRQSRSTGLGAIVGTGSGAMDNGLTVVDCTPILADLLGAWPKDVVMMTDSIVITPISITIRGSAPESQDVQTLAKALEAAQTKGAPDSIRGWSLLQPQVNASREGVQATVQLNRPATKEGSS